MFENVAEYVCVLLQLKWGNSDVSVSLAEGPKDV